MTLKIETLKPGSTVDQYQIQGVIGSGGFSVVYSATDLENNQKVVIKEFMPRRLAIRETNGNVVPKSEADTEIGRASCRERV